MKRTYCTLLSLLLVATLVLAGCKSSDKPSGTQTNDSTAPESTVQNTQAPTEKATEPTPTETMAPESDAKPASLGKLEGKVYTNEYAGFACKLDDNWEIHGVEEIGGVPKDVAEALKDTSIGELAATITQIMDMQAQNTKTGTSINVLYTKLGETERMACKLMDEEKIVDAMLINKDLMIESYARTGMDVKSMEKATAEFMGEKHTVCKTVASMKGIDVYVVQVLNNKLDGEYGITLTFSALSEAEIESAMNCFYKVS